MNRLAMLSPSYADDLSADCPKPGSTMRRLSLFAILFVILVAGLTPAWAKQLEGFTYEEWTGTAWADDTTGNFTSCGVSASYPSGIALHLFAYADQSMAIGFSNSAWTLKEGESYSIKITIDSVPLNVHGLATGTNLVQVTFEPNDALLPALQKGKRLLLTTQTGAQFIFNIKHTWAALERVQACLNQYVAAASSNPFAANTLPGVSKPAGSNPFGTSTGNVSGDASAMSRLHTATN